MRWISNTKAIAAPLLALLLLSLVWALLAWAAPVGSTPASAPPAASARGRAEPQEEALVWVSAVVSRDADVARFFVGPVYRRAVGDLRRVSGRVRGSDLPRLAGQPGVIHVPSADPPPAAPAPDPAHSGGPTLDPSLRGRERVAAILSREAQRESGLAPAAPLAPTGWYENDTQGVRETWNRLGLSGSGATIAVLDSGVDFGNPALAGRYAVQPTTLSGTQAYVGWPIAFDDRSLSAYLAEPGLAWPDNWGWYVNASHAITGSGVFTFADPQSATDVYTAPGASLSGRYLLGYHPDTSLGGALLLVADEAVSGVYDAVYADLDYDGDFETRMSQDQPVGVLDLTGDGVQDVSAGMLYWIADGLNPPPGAEAVYGPGVPAPEAGALLAFMIDDLWESGGGHGTMCAGTAVGNDGGLFAPESRVASFYSGSYGPLVQGPAPEARVAALGNVYAGGSVDAWYLFTVLGYDGAPGSGDEPQIATLSFGSGEVDNDGWDWESRYLTYLNLVYGDGSPLFVHSAGNGGFGYGTVISPKAATGLNVGASTQYGTLNAWGISETVSLPTRVNYGDVASFSGRGPGADGTRAVDLVANGMAGTGAYPLNGSGDGTRAYVHWSGTSRSAPVVGGMAALAAQAFQQARGRPPTCEELRGLLINSARDLGYDPLVQGAGQANAFRAAQAALGRYGVTVEPPVAVAGDFRGQRYPAFAAGLSRGEAQTLTFSVTNPSAAAIPLTLQARRLVEVARYSDTIETITDTFTNYHAGAPDYALDLTGWVTAHPEADLMVVRLTTPFEHFNDEPPNPPTVRNAWRLMVYNWWDVHDDGLWWTDLNGNGRINGPEELDGGDEWMRFDYSRLEGAQLEVRVGRPYARSLGAGSGGVWAGAAHYRRSAGDNRTTLIFEAIFYRHVDWPEVSLSTDAFQLEPGERAVFQATVRVPPDAAHGLYQGQIVVADAGRTDLNPTYYPHRTIVPLTWQVWPDLEAGAVLGGADRSGMVYDNAWIGGGFSWKNNEESTDWRFYGFDLYEPAAGSFILARNVWTDYPTDIDTLIMGPTRDKFSAALPGFFGPYRLEMVGRSALAGLPPVWHFQTATGGTEDWVSTPAQDGLHLLAHRSVLFGGHRGSVPFTTSLGLVQVSPYPLRLDPADCSISCTVAMTLRSTLDISGGVTGAHAFGWLKPITFSAQSIAQDQIVTHGLVFTQALYRLEAALENVSGAGDLDLFLYDDSGAVPGAWDAADQELASATGPGAEELLVKQALLDGAHWLRVEGAAVDPGGGSYDLRVVAAPWAADGALSFAGLPAEMEAHHTYTFTVHVERAPAVGRRGLLVLGPPALPRALDAPIVVERLADLWVHKVGPALAQPGQTIAYSITYGNRGPSEAHSVWLTDTLPTSVTTSLPTALGPLTLTVGSSYTWRLTATVGASVPVGTALTNAVRVAGLETDLRPGDDAAEAVCEAAGADLWVHKAGPTEAQSGQTITYTIAYGNLGKLTAHGVRLTDTLPFSVAATAPTTLYAGTLAPGAAYTWTLTATLEADLPPAALVNAARIAGVEFDPLEDNNETQVVTLANAYHVYLPLVLRQLEGLAQ